MATNRISERIYTAIRASDLSYGELSRITNIPKSALQRYATGETEKCPLSRIEAIANATGVSPGYLMGWQDDPVLGEGMPTNAFPIPKRKTVPLLGAIACGLPLLAEENFDGSVTMPEDVQADFALRCVGDSMIGARICDGDIVYIRKTYDFKNGDICAVLVDGDEATLKRVYRISESLLELRAENPSFPIQRYEGEDITRVQIVGKAVAFTSNVKH